MRLKIYRSLAAMLFSLALHGGGFLIASALLPGLASTQTTPQLAVTLVILATTPPTPQEAPAPQPRPSAKPPPQVARTATTRFAPDTGLTSPGRENAPASMEAPPAPSAEEWAFAAKYTLKNSKGYRYNWGQQVRSLMGTAIEGPDQGLVRFQVEIAPDGTLAKLVTLWTTSTVAEQLARKAVEAIPPLPPTPTGKPLIFEKTISFSAFASDGPPIYRDDCLPDPPTFRNPFAWDGKSPQVRATPQPVEKPDPQALEECLRQLPQDTIEAESANDQRLLDQWGSRKSGR